MSNNKPQDEKEILFQEFIVNTSNTPNNPEKLICYIAYAQYLHDIYDYQLNCEDANNEDVEKYRQYYIKKNKEELKKSADQLLIDYTNTIIVKDTREKLEQVQQNLSSEIQKIQEKRPTQYFHGVSQGIIASVIFSLLVFLLAVGIRISAPNSAIGLIVQYLTAPDLYELEIIEKKPVE